MINPPTACTVIYGARDSAALLPATFIAYNERHGSVVAVMPASMATVSSCAMCLMAFLTTTTSLRFSAQLDHCLRQRLPSEWNSEQYRQRGCVVIHWNVPPPTDVSTDGLHFTTRGEGVSELGLNSLMHKVAKMVT